MEYVGKYSVSLQHGGNEEGGWWYDEGTPEWKFGIPLPEWLAFKVCRWLNGKEKERAEKEEDYEYTSVLSYKSNHYSYTFSDYFKLRPYPESRPFYE